MWKLEGEGVYLHLFTKEHIQKTKELYFECIKEFERIKPGFWKLACFFFSLLLKNVIGHWEENKSLSFQKAYLFIYLLVENKIHF